LPIWHDDVGQVAGGLDQIVAAPVEGYALRPLDTDLVQVRRRCDGQPYMPGAQSDG
jgi:hypothetical protein